MSISKSKDIVRDFAIELAQSSFPDIRSSHCTRLGEKKYIRSSLKSQVQDILGARGRVECEKRIPQKILDYQPCLDLKIELDQGVIGLEFKPWDPQKEWTWDNWGDGIKCLWAAAWSNCIGAFFLYGTELNRWGKYEQICADFWLTELQAYVIPITDKGISGFKYYPWNSPKRPFNPQRLFGRNPPNYTTEGGNVHVQKFFKLGGSSNYGLLKALSAGLCAAALSGKKALVKVYGRKDIDLDDIRCLWGDPSRWVKFERVRNV